MSDAISFTWSILFVAILVQPYVGAQFVFCANPPFHCAIDDHVDRLLRYRAHPVVVPCAKSWDRLAQVLTFAEFALPVVVTSRVCY